MSELYDLLERLGNLVRAEERALGQELGLQPVHLHVLRYLQRCNRFSDNPAAITEYLGQTKGTVSQSLNRLRDKGLIDRVADPDDGRRVHLRLTAAGRRAADRLVPRAMLEGFDRLVPELEGLLTRLLDSRAARPFGVCSSCRFHELTKGRARCGLLGVRLAKSDVDRICREFEPA